MTDMKVELMAHSGNDLLVVNTARASFGKESSMEIIGWKEYDTEEGLPEAWAIMGLKEKDKKLLDYLAREKHVLPFRHPQVTLRCKTPIFLARQLGKHQVGMSWSEESRRYITTEPEFYWPDKWRKKADNVKQGSSDEEFNIFSVSQGIYPDAEVHARDYMEIGVELYTKLVEAGCAPEQARMILPQAAMTTWVWTGSLLSFYQLYKLRAEAHAQKEARDFAEMIKAEVSKLYPESWAALERHV